MSARTALLFGVHAHQPYGNFPEVLRDACERSYGPFLRTLHEFPRFRFAIHLSGPLLDYLCERRADDVALLADMARRGQAEIFGAGDAEPVLASIPARDRVGQLDALSRRIAQRFGVRPQGAWLTERVWEATVVPALADCGIRYAAVDDYHFLCTGRAQQELGGFFTTEEDGCALDLFPISEALRYAIPFAPAAEAVAAIARTGAAAVYFDDLEKFGIWPETFEWVYQKGWLREFISRVLDSPDIETLTYAQFHARERSRGVVYLPSTSYIEMNQWSLPAAAAGQYAGLLDEQKRAGRYAERKAFLRGGIWKNFLSRYPESNWMHKRMLALSARLARAESGARSGEMRALLYAAQSNDAYWHGLFGGLYLPHLRRAVWQSLLRLEARLEAGEPSPERERADLDLDGADELFLRNAKLHAAIRLDGEAALREFASYALAQNFGDTLRRHAEHYHERLGEPTSEHAGGGIASAHDRVAFRHALDMAGARPDARARSMFLDTLIDAAGGERPIADYALEDAPGAARFRSAADAPGFEKRIALEDDRLRVVWRVPRANASLRTRVDLAMPSCDGYAGRYLHRGAIPGGFGQPLALDPLDQIVLDDRHMRGQVVVGCDPPARFTAAPCHTVSQSEGGFEKVMQSVTLEFTWPLDGEHREISLTLRVIPD